MVRINYYPPRGDNKEGWDNIDIFGWMGYPMQIKVDFLCRDSILAAPIVLDLAIFADLAKRCGMSGIQEWLSFYFKSPQTAPGLYPEHDLFIQLMKLKNTLRHLRGEELDHAPGARVLRLAPLGSSLAGAGCPPPDAPRKSAFEGLSTRCASCSLQQQRDQRLPLADLAALHHPDRLVQREGRRLDLLVRLGAGRDGLEAGRPEEVHHLVAEAGRRPEDEEGLDGRRAEADFLLQLPAGAFLGRLARVAPAGRQLPHEGVHRVAVLAHEDDAAVVEDGQRGHRAALAHDLAQPP